MRPHRIADVAKSLPLALVELEMLGSGDPGPRDVSGPGPWVRPSLALLHCISAEQMHIRIDTCIFSADNDIFLAKIPVPWVCPDHQFCSSVKKQ